MKYIEWIIILALHFTFSLALLIPFTIFLIYILQIQPNLLNLILCMYPIDIIQKRLTLKFFQYTTQFQHFLTFFLLAKYIITIYTLLSCIFFPHFLHKFTPLS